MIFQGMESTPKKGKTKMSLTDKIKTISEFRNEVKNGLNDVNSKEIIDVLTCVGDNYLRAYNFFPKSGPGKEFTDKLMVTFEEVYLAIRKRASELGVDISKYPETLAELTK